MNWKEMCAFFVLAMFLFIPVAFAEDDAADDATADADANDVETAKQTPARNNANEKIEVTKEKLEIAKEQFKQAKEKLEAASEKYAEAKKSIESNKERLKECKEEATEDCALVVKEVKKDVKDFLLGAADKILATLEKVKSKIEESSMNAETQTKILAKIDERIAAVNAAKENINALTETSTKAEIKEATAGLREAWKDSKVDIKLEAGRLANDKVHGIVVKSKQLQTKLETTITKLSEKGYDVSGIEELKASFDAKLAEAKTHYDAAFAKYEQEVVPGEVDALMKEANAEMKLAQNALQEAHKILKAIVDEIKGTQEKGVKEEKENKTEESEEENETEVEEEEETPENETEEAEQPEAEANETEED